MSSPPGLVRRGLGALGVLLILASAAGLLAGGFLLGQRLDRRGDGGAPQASAGIVATPGPAASASGAPITSGPTARLLGAGDIASCQTVQDERTAELVLAIPGIVFTAGDNAYNRGTTAEYRRCYDPSWGQFRSRTRPAAGNHDVLTNNGAAYYAYFGAAAGTAPDGWYSYDAGTWHVVVLNSNCSLVGGCGEGSRQLDWLKADLAAHPAACTVAIWHHPRFSSGEHGSDVRSADFWNVLYAAGAELVLNGHEHDYERFAPQDPEGRLDPARGIREFVVGTGGAQLRLFNPPVANSELREARTYGILVLDLAPGGYDWHFLSTTGRAFSDNGSGVCH
jgi:3',5'-cyclic AMP phosphodiesterase CpdA